MNVQVQKVEDGYMAIQEIPDGSIKGPLRATLKEAKKDVPRIEATFKKFMNRQSAVRTLYDSKKMERPQISDAGFLAGVIEKENYL